MRETSEKTLDMITSCADVLDNWDEDVSEINVDESFEDLEQSLITLLSETNTSDSSSSALNTSMETEGPSHKADSNLEVIEKSNPKKKDIQENIHVTSKSNASVRNKRVLKRPHFDTISKPVECKRLKSKTDGLACLDMKLVSHNEYITPVLDHSKVSLNSLQIGKASVGAYRSSSKTSTINSSPEGHNKENCVSVSKLASKTKGKQQIKSAFENIVNTIPARNNQTHKVQTEKTEIQFDGALDENKDNNHQVTEKSSDSSKKFGGAKCTVLTELLSSQECQSDLPEGIVSESAVSKGNKQLGNYHNAKLSEMPSTLSNDDALDTGDEKEFQPFLTCQQQVEPSVNSQTSNENQREQDLTAIHEMEYSEVPCVTPSKPSSPKTSSSLSSELKFSDYCEPCSPGKLTHSSSLHSDKGESSSSYCTQTTSNTISTGIPSIDSDKNNENPTHLLDQDNCPTPKTHLNCKQCNQNLKCCICYINENSEDELEFDVPQKFDSCSQTPKVTSVPYASFVSSTPVIHKINIADNMNCNNLSVIKNSDQDESVKLDCDEEENSQLNELSFEHWLKSGAIEAQLNASNKHEKEMCGEDIDEVDVDEDLEATLTEFNLETLRDIVNLEKSLKETDSEVCNEIQAKHDADHVKLVNTSFQKVEDKESYKTCKIENQGETKVCSFEKHILSTPKKGNSSREYVVIDEDSSSNFITGMDVGHRSGEKCIKCLDSIESNEDVKLVKYSASVKGTEMSNKSENSSNLVEDSKEHVSLKSEDSEIIELIEVSGKSESGLSIVEDGKDHTSNKSECSKSVEVSGELERTCNFDHGESDHALTVESGSSQNKALEAADTEEVKVICDIEKNKTSANHNKLDFEDVKTLELDTVTNLSVNSVLSTENNKAYCSKVKLTSHVNEIKQFQSPQSPPKIAPSIKDKHDAGNEFKAASMIDAQFPESLPVLPQEAKDSVKMEKIKEGNQQTISEPKVKKVQPVIFIEEHKDIEDPDWDIIKKLDTDEKRYKQVRSRWMSRNIPDPNQNLTALSFRKRRVLMEKKFKHSPILSLDNRGHKRSASEKPSSHTNKRARTRTVPCTYIIDSKIESVKRQFDMATKHATDTYFSQLHILTKQQENLERNQWKKEQEAISNQYYRYPFYDTYVNAMSATAFNMHMMQNETEKNRLRFDHEQKVSEARRKYDTELNALVEAREEISKFCSFYKGLNGKNDENDPTLITESQLQELNEIDNIYEQFKHHYYDPNK